MKSRIWNKIVLLTTLTVLPTAYFLAYPIIARCKAVFSPTRSTKN